MAAATKPRRTRASDAVQPGSSPRWYRNSYRGSGSQLGLDLLERWHINKQANDEAITAFEQDAYEKLTAFFATGQQNGPSPESLDFLNKDFGEVDLAALLLRAN